MRPEHIDEDTEREITRVDRGPWFEEDEPLERPDPERLATSTAALRLSLDRLERTLSA